MLGFPCKGTHSIGVPVSPLKTAPAQRGFAPVSSRNAAHYARSLRLQFAQKLILKIYIQTGLLVSSVSRGLHVAQPCPATNKQKRRLPACDCFGTVPTPPRNGNRGGGQWPSRKSCLTFLSAPCARPPSR